YSFPPRSTSELGSTSNVSMFPGASPQTFQGVSASRLPVKDFSLSFGCWRRCIWQREDHHRLDKFRRQDNEETSVCSNTRGSNGCGDGFVGSANDGPGPMACV